MAQLWDRGQFRLLTRLCANGKKHYRIPRIGAMEATMFMGWIYDTLKPRAHELKVANPIMLRAITERL